MGLGTVVVVFAHGWSSGGTVLTVSRQREEARKRKAKFIVAKLVFFDVCIQYLLRISEAGFGRGRSGCRIPRSEVYGPTAFENIVRAPKSSLV